MKNELVIKIATMMLQAATYRNAWIELHPIVTHREGRNETYATIAKAFASLTGADEQEVIKQLEGCNGHNQMEIRLSGSKIAELREKWHNAPIYRDAKNRQYIMYNGVYTQSLCYQVIEVERYSQFEPTGKYYNIRSLEARLARQSAKLTIDAYDASGVLNALSEEEYLRLCSEAL